MSLAVIIVEDHAPMWEMLASVFRRAGADVREAPAARAGLALFEQFGADLVVLDQTMPSMTAVPLILELRARDPTLRLILLSGRNDPELREEARQAGADAVLLKPVSPRELMGHVNALMAEREPCPPGVEG